MSLNSGISLSRDKILQLLASVGSNPQKANPEIASQDYNWKEPHFFTKQQIEKVGEYAKSAADAIAARFTRFFQNDFQAENSSTKQYYAGYYVAETIEKNQKGYHLILKNQQNAPCGLIAVPTASAYQWLTILLGDSESRGDAQVELSRLETSLLSDIARSIAEALLSGKEKINLLPDSNISGNQFSLDIGNSEEIIEITFDIYKKESQDKTQAHFVVPSKLLSAIAGKTEAAKSANPKDTHNAILDHLKEIPVPITAALASTELSFEQILSIQPGDILLLEKKINEPISIVITGQERFYGRLAKSNNKLAAVITAACPAVNPSKDT